jgi:hypothetical protein
MTEEQLAEIEYSLTECEKYTIDFERCSCHGEQTVLVAEVRRLREHIRFSHGGHSFHYDDCTIDLCGKVNRDCD